MLHMILKSSNVYCYKVKVQTKLTEKYRSEGVNVLLKYCADTII